MKIARYLVALMVTSACTPSASPPEAGEAPALARQASGLDGGTPSCPSDAGSCVPVSPEITQGESCPDSRWIAVLPDATNGCPYVPPGESGQWNRSQLFQSSSGGWSLPPELARFCAYTWAPNTSGGTPSQQDVNQLQATLHQAETLDRDCHVVAPLGTNAAIDAGWTTLHAHFHQQTGRLESLPVDSSSFPEEVRVAVVDSTPHGYDGGEAGQDRLGHGHVIGRIIRELGCPEGSPACVAQVANHLALPLVRPSVWDTENGGYFGLQTHLARAIHSSVSEWRGYNANLETGASPQPRLVVNLSLAWDGRYGGAYNVLGDLPAPVRAVHAAITHAVCRGALVVAAAGNDPGGPDPVIGPMFPAGWETKAAPTPSECDTLEGAGYRDGELYPSFPPPGWSGYRPLVYAVGGVRGDDRPLASTRPGGRPRTAAPGAHAVAGDVDANGNPVPTDVLTGTSASTAVVSGIAATVWGYRPELSGPEVMKLIRQASVDLGQPADFCLGGSPACPWGVADPRRSIRRVSLCQSVLEACSGGLGRCPVASVLPQVCPSHPASLPRLTAAEAAEAESHIEWTESGSSLNISLPPLDVCGHTTLHSGNSSYEETVCPFRQYYGAPLKPWSNPVASKNPCTVCRMQTDMTSSTATLYLGIDSDFASRDLNESTLLVNRSHEIELSNLPALTGGNEVKVTDIQLDPTWLPVTHAEFTLKGPGNDAYSSELLLE